jgi:hypothetical protein
LGFTWDFVVFDIGIFFSNASHNNPPPSEASDAQALLTQ